MLTARGLWFLVVVVFLVALGTTWLAVYTVVPAILGLTLLAWFVFEWAAFQTRSHGAAARLRVSRRIVQGGRDVPMVWAGLAFEVRVTVWHDGVAAIPYAELDDRLPVLAEKTAGQNAAAAVLRPGEPVRLTYTLTAPSPGVVRFEGVRVRIADVHGFFVRRAFLRDATEYHALPPLSDDEGHQRATKRFNTLPPPGVHRFRRPGTGSELLDLRDYRAGDPPKMIAWKPSARRDRLITKEFESEVPVRAVLFLDTSAGMRLGPPGNTPLTRMTTVASAVAQAAAGNRDLVGLTTFDETESKGAPPARTKRHMIDIMRRLSEVAVLQPPATGVPPDHLTRRAYPLAHELYPELMTKAANAMQLGRLWIPLLDKRWGWVIFWVMVLFPPLALSVFWAGVVVEQTPWMRPVLAPLVGFSQWWFATTVRGVVDGVVRRRSWGLAGRLIAFLLLWPPLFFLPVILGLVFWFIHGSRGWFGERKRQLTQRKQLAALFALQYGVGPGAVERLIHDDEAYAARVSRFFQEHQTRCPVPLYDDAGRYRYRCPEKAGVLAGAITRAVGRARDNELYVLLADLAELGPDVAPVVKAARLARARHHQVLVILPWPADVPPPVDGPSVIEVVEEPTGPPRKPAKKGRDLGSGRRKHAPTGPLGREKRLMPVVKDSLTRHYHQAFREFRRALGRVGATVVRVTEGDPVRLVLERLDRLRGMRTRR